MLPTIPILKTNETISNTENDRTDDNSTKNDIEPVAKSVSEGPASSDWRRASYDCGRWGEWPVMMGWVWGTVGRRGIVIETDVLL